MGQGSLCASGACILCDPCLLNGYNGSTVPGSNTCNVPGPFCGSIENNQWWAFLAPQSGTVTFNFTVTNCTGAGTGSGIQAEIYSTNTCNDFVSVSNCWSPGAQQNGSVTANNLTPFCTYYLMVDGWAGDFCDFTINTTDCVVPPPPQVYSVVGPQNVCPGATVNYTMTPNPNNSGGGGCGNNSNIIQWNGISPNGVIIGPSDEPTITVQWLTSGVATITASYTNVCFGGSATIPLPVTITPIPPTVLNFNPCLGDCVPCGNMLACTPGLTQVVMQSWLGCDSTINCILNPIPPIPPVLKEVTICYPSTYSICGETFNTCGAHSNSCPNWQGCDSTTVVDLAILRPIANIAAPAVLSCAPGATVALNGSASTVGTACAPNVTTTYSWTGPPGGITGPANTNMAQASLPGQYCLTVTHARGGVSCTDMKCVTVIKDNNVPQTPQITGNNNPCPGVPVQYTVTPVGTPAPTDYTWTTTGGVPFTTINNGTGIEVTWPTSGPGQQVCVTANNSCGSSNPACFNVNVAAAPTATISGSGSVCPNSNDDVNLTITLTGAGPWTLSYAINGTTQTPPLSIPSSPYTLVATQVGSYTLVNLSGSAGCAGVVNGTATVSAYPVPTATLSGTQSICQGSGQMAGLNVALTGSAPWSLTYAVNNNNQAPITVNASPYTLMLGQSQAGNITLVSLTDGNGCTGTVSGSGTVTLNTAPTVSNIQSPCDGTNTSFTVSFTINGGDPATYSVTPANGTLTGNMFTSNPIPAGSGYSFVVTDGNNCNPVTVDDPSVPCNCASVAGDMGPAIQECGNGPVTAGYDGNHVFDADDTLAFVLHNGSGINIVPPILGTFTTPTVSFDPATMSYGTTYYLSAVVGNNNGSGGVDLTDNCLDVAQGTPIVFYEIPTATLSGNPVICVGNTATFTVDFTGESPWSITFDNGTGTPGVINGITSNPYTLTIPNAQTSTVCLTGMSDVNCPGNASGCGDIQANTGVNASASVTCDLSGTFYTVQITISGGDPASYFVTPNTGALVGNVFTSNPINDGQGYIFTVDDANGCSPIMVQQTEIICDCTTEVGVMTGSAIDECGNGPVTATYDNTLQVLDPDDVQSFILHTNSGTNPGTVLATSNTAATFSFNPANMSYGTTYYISAVVGNNDGTGFVDLQDGCLALAQGTPVTFYEVPTATITGSTSICEGDSAILSISFTGKQPWQVTVGGQVLSNIMALDYELSVSPATTTTYTLSALSDANCPGTVSGSATVTVNQAPQIQNVTTQCDLSTNTYTVSFQITGGNPASYTVLPLNSGPLVGNTFTSNPIASLAPYTFTVDDGNACGPDQITGTKDCNCTTDAGTMTTSQINACQGETVTVPATQNPVIDPTEDVLIYYLHDGNGNVLGTVFGTNTEPTFTFNPATMQTGVTYYISPVAGDNNGSGGVDLADNCLDIAPGTPVMWSETPSISLVASDAICEGDDAEVTVTFTGVGPSYTVAFTVGGIPSSQTFTTSPFTFMLPLPSTTTITLVSVTDNASGCSAPANQSTTVFVSQNVDAGSPVADFKFCDDVSQTISLGSNLQNPDPGGVWTDANGNPVPNGSLNVLSLSPGTYPYTYTVTTTPPCLNDQATLNVVIHPNPVADAGQDYQLDCDETEATLGGNNSTPNLNYAWSGGTFSDPSILNPVINGPGTYTLTVTNPLTGCSDTDVAVVTQLQSEPVAHVTVAGVSCFGDQDGFIVIDSITGGVPPYLCSLNGSPFSTQKQFTNLSPGFFTLELVDAAGCGGTQEFLVIEPEKVNVHLELDVENNENTNLIVLGDSARLRVISTPPFDSLDGVIWSPGSGIDCNTCDTIWISPTQQTTFAITVDKNGCTDSDQLTVFVKKERPVYIPNAFSPNGDANNDRFMIFAGNSVVQVKSFLIFNRWGESVFQFYNFQPNDPAFGWDGTHRGKPMDPAVFVYFAEIEFIDGRVELYEGDVTLMK
ncbi:MAG: gliding motility-associated C-terminal domain-containing protein [Lewinellaceae bacterium]|nr:gliding motility-associated C-terminal domain-containing protein [Saprospiraceae bacterium]MCB9339377.1 gliding motility-associated C-terminal domain-containing protein [Lewinellaceae bacterium]